VYDLMGLGRACLSFRRERPERLYEKGPAASMEVYAGDTGACCRFGEYLMSDEIWGRL